MRLSAKFTFMAFRILALIPARSGSRGLRHKNVQKVGGIPMLQRAVSLALQSQRRGESWHVMVSTDSRAYADLAKKAGADVPWLRPKRLSSSGARLIDVVLYTLEWQERRGHTYDAVAMLSAATPLTAIRDLRKAIRMHRRQGDAVISVTKSKIPDPWRFGLEGGRLTATAQNHRIDRRQVSPDRYQLNGAIYIATPAWLNKHRQFFVPNKSIALVMPDGRSVDVDSKLDLDWARFLCSTEFPRGDK
ncbi:MAG: hypothetical protein A2289_06375 [Deltaproteobacteria bacterium RIFOXYA12_FULL_58_15]|nr:MAG: hypothetical protein A2289_06375 [Deltaproteobacteria bacterium RIFOXYA12_FULL_58_15]OGR11681.1 MAG: hypothetical protein A2341_02365 [Deltaproteobacteria bacterium RIFOXYB12_FULL_58_9]